MGPWVVLVWRNEPGKAEAGARRTRLLVHNRLSRSSEADIMTALLTDGTFSQGQCSRGWRAHRQDGPSTRLASGATSGLGSPPGWGSVQEQVSKVHPSLSRPRTWWRSAGVTRWPLREDGGPARGRSVGMSRICLPPATPSQLGRGPG